MRFVGLACEYPECKREIRWTQDDTPPPETLLWSIYQHWDASEQIPREFEDIVEFPLCPEHGQQVAQQCFGFKGIEDAEVEEWLAQVNKA